MPTIDPTLASESSSQLERLKFGTNDAGDVFVRTSGEGTFSQQGLSTGGRVTEVTLNSSTWTALPATPLANRNAISIQNRTGIEIKVNYSSGVSGYVGMVIPSGGERFYDITDAIIIYAKSTTGTPTINVEELA
jgi:hypothetical protein